MPDLPQIAITETASLDRQTFGELGCIEHGIIVLRGADSWNAHETGYIKLPVGTYGSPLVLPLSYDEREAPYVVGTDGREQADLLVSLTDENGCIACAWARTGDSSPLMGVGVDLCALDNFAVREGRRDFTRLLFTERERQLAHHVAVPTLPLAFATLFAAKEAAFKATAAPLRRWYETQDEQLRYEVRHFVAEELGTELGTGRNAAAQAALERMGVGRIAVTYTAVEDMALVVACALSA